MRKVLSKLAIATAALVGAVSSAQAYVILTLSDVSGGFQQTKTCDTSVGGCSAEFGVFALGANSLTFTGTVGDFQVSQTSGITVSNSTFALAQANNNLVNRTDGAAGTQGLVIEFTAMDVMAPPDVLKFLSGSGSMSGVPFGVGPTDTVLTRVAVNSANANTFFPPNGPAGTSGTVTAMACSFIVATNASCAATDTGTTGVGSTQVLWTDPVAPFSFQTLQRFDINSTAFVGTTATAVVSRVPEPASTALVGIALFGLALSARRRSAKKV